MATNNWDVHVLGVAADLLRNELVGTNAIKSSNTNNVAWVKTTLLVQLTHSWDNRVHWVDNKRDHSIWAPLGASVNDTLGNTSIDAEEVVTSHAWLTWHTSWDEDQVAARERFLTGLELRLGRGAWVDRVEAGCALRLQMTQIGCYTTGWNHRHGDIVNAELGDVVIHGHKECERLADATGTTADEDLKVTSGHD